MIETVFRLKVTTCIIGLIQFFYREPTLGKIPLGNAKVRGSVKDAHYPHIFSVWSWNHCLLIYVEQELNTPRQQQPINDIHFAEMLYADDTLIFGANTHCINVLLHAIERRSAYLG